MAGARGIVLSMAAGSLECRQDGSWTKRGFKAPPAAHKGRFGQRAQRALDLVMSPEKAETVEALGEALQG